MAKTSYYKYANRQAESAVNWTEVANDMNTMLQTTAAMRQARKDQIDEASREFGETLSNAPQGEAVNINQYALDHADNAQQYMLMQDQLLKSGKIKLKDYNLGRTNLEQGTKSLFETMKEAQEQYKVKMERAKASGTAIKMEDGSYMVGSQKLETWLMEEVEAFGNFNNTSAFINPTNGMVSIMKRKDATGKAQGRTATGQAIGSVPTVNTMAPAGQTPADYLSIQQLRQNVTQKFDKYDLSAGLKDQVDMLAETYVTASMTPGNKYYGMFESIDDVKQNPDFLAAQDKIITEIKANEYNAASILTNTATVNANGIGYTYTRNPELQGQEVFPVANLSQAQKDELTAAGIDVSGVNVKYDDVTTKLTNNALSPSQISQREEAILLIDNPSQMSAGMPVPVFTDDQNDVIDNTVRNRMNVMIDRDVNAQRIQTRTEFSPQAYKPSAAEIGRDEKRDKNFGYLREIEQLQTQPKGQFESVAEARIEEQNILRKERGETLMIQDIDRDNTHFTIKLQDPNNPARTKEVVIDRYQKNQDDTYDMNKPLSKKQVSKKLAAFLVPLDGSFSGLYDEYEKSEGGVEKDGQGNELKIDYTEAGGSAGVQTQPPTLIADMAQDDDSISNFIEEPAFANSGQFANNAMRYMDNIGLRQGDGSAGSDTFKVKIEEDGGLGGGNEGTMTITVNGELYTPDMYNATLENNRFESDQLNMIEGFVQYVINDQYARHNQGVKQNRQSNPAPSDIRLKKNYKVIGISEKGYNIYSFEYIDSKKYGEGVYQGVMAQEVPHARTLVGNHYHVDYSKLDVEFKKIK